MMGFRYKLSDLECSYCDDRKKAGCYMKLCPHIMENLPDLFIDGAFREAIQNAESCDTLHKYTLLYLKKHSIERGYRLVDEKRELRCDIKPACRECTYAAHGFICHSAKDGSCLKDWLKELRHGER